MHILFLTDNFPPESNAPATRTYEHARHWVAAGHRVTIITCAPNFPNGRVFDGYRNRLWQSEMLDGIRVIRVWSYMTANAGMMRRTLDYLSFMIMGFWAGLFVRKPDIVIGTSPQFFTLVAAWGVAVIKRRAFVLELRDLWPESIRAVEAMRNRFILGVLERLELFFYRRARAIIALTHSFKANLTARGIAGDKIHIVTNGVDMTRLAPMAKDSGLQAELDLADKFVVGYIGTHGLAHGLGTLLDAAARLEAERDIRFLFVGEGAARRALMADAEARGLENLVFCSAVSRDAVRRYWSVLDVAIIHLRKSPTFEGVIPSKMFECFAMGLPILHGVSGESAAILEASGAGVCFEAENAGDLAKQIKLLAGDSAAHKAYAEAARTAAQHYDRKTLALSMLAVLEGLVSS